MTTSTPVKPSPREELEAKLAAARRRKPRTTEAKKAVAQDIRMLEDKLKELDKAEAKQEKKEEALTTFDIGDHVIKINKEETLGTVTQVESPNDAVTISVTWEGTPESQLTPKPIEPCDHTLLIKIDPDLVEYTWQDEKGFARQYDGAICSDLAELTRLLEDNEDEEKCEWIVNQYNEVVNLAIAVGDVVIYDEKEYVVSDIETVKGSGLFDEAEKDKYTPLLYVSANNPANPAEGILVLAEELQTLTLSQQIAREKPEPLEEGIEWADIDSLVLDPTLQQRAKYDSGAIAEYAEITDKLAPVTVFETEEGQLLVVDGFHTVRANAIAGNTRIRIEKEKGEYNDAFGYSFTVNKNRGVRLTRGDLIEATKNAIVGRDKGILLNKRGKPMSNRQIAELVGVSFQTVNNYVNRAKAPKGEEPKPPTEERKVDKEGVPTAEEGSLSDDEATEEEEGAAIAQESQGETDEPGDLWEEEPTNPATERPDQPLKEGDLVRIKGNATSKALMGHQNKYMKVVGVTETHLDLETWDNRQIVGISRGECSLVTGPIKVPATLTPEQITQIMDKFDSIEDAIAAAMAW